MNLDTLTLQEIRKQLQQKAFSCRELVAAYYQRIAAVDPAIHAYLLLTSDAANRQADQVDTLIAEGRELGPLSGQPIAIKDVLATKGVPTTAGSRILEQYRPPYHATVVEKLLDAGAVLLGKTNCDEFAMGASGENSAYGPTTNPWDITRVPGGSSSGSAAAVAAGECVAALGTDTGGSIRQPAGFCGVVGLKPTYGRVSRYGLVALASSLDQVGPLTRTVEDAATMLNILAGQDVHDATSVDKPGVAMATVQGADVRGMKIGVPKEYFLDGMDPEVEKLVRASIKHLEDAGAAIVEVSLPHTEYALAVYYLILPAEASSNLARYDGIRYGLHKDGKDLSSVYLESRHAGFGNEVKRRIMLGTYALSAGYHDAYYLKAQKVRTLIRQDFAKAFQAVDALITPTSPSLPFKLGEKFADPLTMYLADIYTVSANLAGLPGLSIPAGRVGNLPVGVQLLGPLWSEERLLTIGRALEQRLAQPLRLPGTPS